MRLSVLVHHKADAGKAHGAALLRAAEDDVLHLAAAAQLLGACLASTQRDGVGYIAFPLPLGPTTAVMPCRR